MDETELRASEASLLAPDERIIGAATSFSQPRAFDRALGGLGFATLVSLGIIALMYAGKLEFAPAGWDFWPALAIAGFMALSALPGHLWARNRAARSGAMSRHVPVRFRQRVLLTDQRVIVVSGRSTVDASISFSELRQVRWDAVSNPDIPTITLEFRDGTSWRSFPVAVDEPFDLQLPAGPHFDPFAVDELAGARGRTTRTRRRRSAA